MMRSPLYDGVLSLQIIDEGADNETLNGSGVDMQGYTDVVFIAAAQGGEDGTFTLKAQQDTASNFANAADLAGSAVSFATTTSAGAVATLHIREPQEQYVRPVLVVPNLTAGKAVAVIAIKFGGKYLPESGNTGELHVAPGEGTA